MPIDHAPDRRRRTIAIAAFLLLSVVLAVLGYVFYQFEKEKVIRAQYQTLAAIDEIKVTDIRKWREDRVAEAYRVARKPEIVELMSQTNRDARWQGQLDAFLRQEAAGRRQVTAILLDSHLNRLTSTGTVTELSDASRKTADSVFSTGQPAFSDFYREPDGVVYVEVAVPVRDVRNNIQAVLMARQDANLSIFAIVRYWPTSSASAESYLVRREGAKVLFLSDVRFHHGAALALSFPLTSIDISSVQAALGTRGIFRGRDYRGVRVVSDLQPVPDSDWLILSEIDEAEVLAVVHGHATEVSLIVLLSILLCGAVVALFYRKRQAKMLKGLVEAEREKAEAFRHMQDAEEQKREILRTAIDGFLLLDTEGKILEVNEAFCGMVGWTAAELSGRRIADLEAMESQEETAAHIRHILMVGRDRFETQLLRKDGTAIDVDVVVQVRRAERLLVVFLRDITDTKKFEMALKQATIDAQAASQAKSEFLAVMSHELRTPLNAVLGFTDFLVETPLNNEQREYLKIIRNSGGHLLDVVNDILDFSSIEKGAITLQSEQFLLAKLIQDCCDWTLRAAQRKSVDFRCEKAPDLPEHLVGDERRIRQILINIVGNALKFTTKGAVVLRVSLARGEGPSTVDFAVEDTGPGMASKDLEKIFQPFTQADSSLGRVFGGTGLGLAISKRLATAMGGAITVSSRLGEGSSFTFRLPIARSLEPPAAGANDLTPRPEGMAAGGLVLVVEDDRVNRLLAKKILESAGFHSECVGDGQAAIDAFAPGKYSAILMDIQMPGVNGLDATKKIREIESRSGGHVPIIALTANVLPEDRHRCFQAGMDDFLTKPFNKHQISSVLLLYTVSRPGEASGAEKRGPH